MAYLSHVAEKAATESEPRGITRTNSELAMLAEKAALLGREMEEPETYPIESNSPQYPLSPPETTMVENPDPLSMLSPTSDVPTLTKNVRGLSEKARGKLRATESTTSLSLDGATGVVGEDGQMDDEELDRIAKAGVGPNRYIPTQDWVSSWQKG